MMSRFKKYFLCLILISTFSFANNTCYSMAQSDTSTDENLKKGVQYYLNNQYDKASEELEKALQKNPNSKETHIMLANCYLRQNKYEQTMLEIQKSLAI